MHACKQVNRHCECVPRCILGCFIVSGIRDVSAVLWVCNDPRVNLEYYNCRLKTKVACSFELSSMHSSTRAKVIPSKHFWALNAYES